MSWALNCHNAIPLPRISIQGLRLLIISVSEHPTVDGAFSREYSVPCFDMQLCVFKHFCTLSEKLERCRNVPQLFLNDPFESLTNNSVVYIIIIRQQNGHIIDNTEHTCCTVKKLYFPENYFMEDIYSGYYNKLLI